MTSAAISNKCSDAWTWVRNNPGTCVAGSVAVIACAPILAHGLYHGVPWLVGNATAVTEATMKSVSHLARNLIEGDPLTLINFTYIGIAGANLIKNITKNKVSEIKGTNKEIDECDNCFCNSLKWVAGWFAINTLAANFFGSEKYFGSPIN